MFISGLFGCRPVDRRDNKQEIEIRNRWSDWWRNCDDNDITQSVWFMLPHTLKQLNRWKSGLCVFFLLSSLTNEAQLLDAIIFKQKKNPIHTRDTRKFMDFFFKFGLWFFLLFLPSWLMISWLTCLKPEYIYEHNVIFVFAELTPFFFHKHITVSFVSFNKCVKRNIRHRQARIY